MTHLKLKYSEVERGEEPCETERLIARIERSERSA